jgi:hypothetical protein
MKDIRSLLLILLSVGLVVTWIYHFYDKTNYSKTRTVYIKDTAAAAGSRDTSAGILSDTIVSENSILDSSQDSSGSLKKQLEIRLLEINKLKSDISNILKNNKSNKNDLALARQKIGVLQQKVQELSSQNSSIDEERKRLNAMFGELTMETEKLQQNVRRLGDENKRLAEKVNLASVFVASALHFTAINEHKEKEQETSLARRADKFVGSFVLQNNLDELMNAEVTIVITAPGGHVLQNSAWDSGTFDTKTGGKKGFTRKLKFNYVKGEQKRLIFSLYVENFKEGKYVLQIWHNGLLIGESAKTLK